MTTARLKQTFRQTIELTELHNGIQSRDFNFSAMNGVAFLPDEEPSMTDLSSSMTSSNNACIPLPDSTETQHLIKNLPLRSS